jgi:hypothetical protein
LERAKRGSPFVRRAVAETWFPINLGLGGDAYYDVSISGLVMDSESPDTLYAATAYHSV